MSKIDRNGLDVGNAGNDGYKKTPAYVGSTLNPRGGWSPSHYSPPTKQFQEMPGRFNGTAASFLFPTTFGGPYAQQGAQVADAALFAGVSAAGLPANGLIATNSSMAWSATVGGMASLGESAFEKHSLSVFADGKTYIKAGIAATFSGMASGLGSGLEDAGMNAWAATATSGFIAGTGNAATTSYLFGGKMDATEIVENGLFSAAGSVFAKGAAGGIRSLGSSTLTVGSGTFWDPFTNLRSMAPETGLELNTNVKIFNGTFSMGAKTLEPFIGEAGSYSLDRVAGGAH